MLNPFPIAEGVVLDTRSILISLSALFFGIIPAIMVVITASILRISAGGDGALTGVLVIFSSGIITITETVDGEVTVMTLDFSAGTECDNIVGVTIDGLTVNIEI